MFIIYCGDFLFFQVLLFIPVLIYINHFKNNMHYIINTDQIYLKLAGKKKKQNVGN
jgi:hypothetical protein